jgi:outer membrane protein TolC
MGFCCPTAASAPSRTLVRLCSRRQLSRPHSDALIAHQWIRASRLEQEKLVAALQDRKRLAYIRYHGGLDTELNALDSDRDLLQAELTLAQIRYSELVSVVQLYKALGGGWQ